MNEVEELTRELVRIPSYEDERNAGDFIEGWLNQETDAAVERDKIGNVLAYNGNPEAALVGHHDTVPPADEQLEDGVPTVERHEGRLYGRGTADMKGALAAAMVAFRDADASKIGFASFVGEERGGIGAEHATRKGFAPDRAVVIEGSTGYSDTGALDVAVVHRGRRELRVVAHGEAEHAGDAGDEGNAVYRAVDIINQIRRYENRETTVEIGDVELSVEGNAVVTHVKGSGEATNVTPSRCEFTVDERTVPDAPGVDLSSLNGEAAVVDEMPPMLCDDDGFAELVREAAREQGSSEFVTKPHATDAGRLSEAGASTVVCGPAERGEAHTDDESVSVDALARARKTYRRVLESV